MPIPLEPPVDAPFLFEAQGDTHRGSVLLVHGFTGTPFEMQGTARALSAAGFDAHGILLPGHGTTPEELAETPAAAWLDHVRASFDALPPSAPRMVVGSSMGGALSLLLVSEGAMLDGLVLFAPALVLKTMSKIGATLATLGAEHVVEMITKADPGGDVENAEGRSLNNGYPVMPMAAIAEMECVRSDAHDCLPKVSCPVLVFHGSNDHTVAPEGSRLLVDSVASEIIEHVVLPNSSHILGLDNDRDQVHADTVRFCVEMATRGQAVA